MKDIAHQIVIEASPSEVFNALTNQEKLSSWWTKAEVKSEVGSIANFFFGPNGEHLVEMNIVSLVPGRQVIWKCTNGPWIDTEAFEFYIEKNERGSTLQFKNTGWLEQNEFYMHCNSKWGFFLTVSLKNLLEKGTGQPLPNEPNI